VINKTIQNPGHESKRGTTRKVEKERKRKGVIKSSREGEYI
jgi:hypothetical protein